jgi:hypothetical protein
MGDETDGCLGPLGVQRDAALQTYQVAQQRREERTLAAAADADDADEVALLDAGGQFQGQVAGGYSWLHGVSKGVVRWPQAEW